MELTSPSVASICGHLEIKMSYFVYFYNVNHSVQVKGGKIMVYLANVSIKRTNVSVELVSCILVILKWKVFPSLVYGTYISTYTDFPSRLPQFTGVKKRSILSHALLS